MLNKTKKLELKFKEINMKRSMMIDLWFNLVFGFRIFLIFLFILFLVGCADKKTILEYPNIKLKNFGQI